MTKCPFPVEDYLSALASADWYEEQGLTETSEQIRSAELLRMSGKAVDRIHNKSSSQTRIVISRTVSRSCSYGFARRGSTSSVDGHFYQFSTSNSREGMSNISYNSTSHSVER